MTLGRHLYIDHSYTRSALFELLFQNKTGAYAIIRKNEKGLPKLKSKLRKQEHQC